MPIIMITSKERLEFRLEPDDESVIFYRRLPPTKRAEFVQKHTTFGEINNLACQLEMCQYCILGWEHLYDVDENEIPYTLAAVNDLPTPVILRLMDVINQTSPPDIIKNFGKRRNGVSPLTA